MNITRCWGKEKDSPQNIERCDKVGTPMPTDQPMDDLYNPLKKNHLGSLLERRKCKACLIQISRIKRSQSSGR